MMFRVLSRPGRQQHDGPNGPHTESVSK